MAHTPGPWTLLRDTDGTQYDAFTIRATSPEAFAQWGLMGDARGCEVAKVRCNPAAKYGPEFSSIEANARLIAAAPDLLAALEGMLDPDTEGDIERAILALAKAKGVEAPEAAIRVVRQATGQWADLQSETEAIDGDQVV